MRHVLVSVIWATAAALAPAPAFADARDLLERFYDEVATFSADFEQAVLDENLNRIEESAGRMWIARPGKFRWDYEPPLEQQIVSDGERVWVYDVELEQVAEFAALFGERSAGAPVVEVPLLSGDVHDRAGIDHVRRSLFAPPSRDR